MIRKIILTSIILLFSTKSSIAQMYTWKDEHGTTHATDNLNNAPTEIQEKYTKPIEPQIKKIPFKDGYIEIKEKQNSFEFTYYIRNQYSPTGYQPKFGCSEEIKEIKKDGYQLKNTCREAYDQFIKNTK